MSRAPHPPNPSLRPEYAVRYFSEASVTILQLSEICGIPYPVSGDMLLVGRRGDEAQREGRWAQVKTEIQRARRAEATDG